MFISSLHTQVRKSSVTPTSHFVEVRTEITGGDVVDLMAIQKKS